jgi:GrpB-like predicted nucleotidyltransferase (UPF0157 family)
MYGMRRDELRLLQHDPAWKDDFLAEKKRILDALEDPSVRIEHVGSTSIPTGHEYAVLDRGDVRLCQAHVFTEANADWHSKLMFRDVLRRDAGLAREYDEYKLGLARTAAGKTEYAEIKSRWVDTFIKKVSAAAAGA